MDFGCYLGFIHCYRRRFDGSGRDAVATDRCFSVPTQLGVNTCDRLVRFLDTFKPIVHAGGEKAFRNGRAAGSHGFASDSRGRDRRQALHSCTTAINSYPYAHCGRVAARVVHVRDEGRPPGPPAIAVSR